MELLFVTFKNVLKIKVALVTLPNSRWHKNNGKWVANKLTKSILPLHYISDWVNNFELMWTQWLKLEHLDQDSTTGDSDSIPTWGWVTWLNHWVK